MPQNAFQSLFALVLSFLCFFVLGSHTFGLNIFAPVLISLVYNVPLTICLWLGALCGCVQDAMCNSFRLGFIALSYIIALLVIYRWRFSFFRDSLLTLPLMTLLFSFLTAVLQCIALFFFDEQQGPSLGWVVTDCLLMPICDGIYAGAVFGIVPLLFKRFSRVHA